MSINNSIHTRSNRASLVVIALIASLLVLVSPVSQSKADYLTFTNYTTDAAITYNDRVCNLGDPSTHLTAATAFEISTADQLWEITDCVSSSATIYFELGDDIDVSQASTAPTNSPIGFSTSALAYSFSGVLDGKNKTISGLAMSTSSYGVGLFAYLHNATISNLVISGSFVTTTSTMNNPAHSAGSLAIRADGTLYLASISNQASVKGWRAVGGLVGWVQGRSEIQGSHNYGNVWADRYLASHTGGLLGYVAGDSTIKSSGNSGEVKGRDYVGGLVGYFHQGSGYFENAFNTGSILGVSSVGGLAGYVRIDATITSSFNAGSVLASNFFAGGLAGFVKSNAYIDSSYNTGPIESSGVAGGLVGRVGDNRAFVAASFNAGSIAGPYDVDGLVGLTNYAVTTSSAYSSFASSFVATTPVVDMKLASTFVGFDFSTVWGFGTCSDNGGYPMLRVFGAVGSYFNASCGVNAVVSSQPEQAPAQTPAPVYSGPVISGAPSAIAGTEVTLTGNRLESVTTAHVGGVQVRIVSALAQSLTLDIPSSMVPGSYDLVLQSSFGTLTIQNGLTVLAPLDTGSVVEATDKKLTVVALQGFIAIYTKGYEGQRLSAKVAGKWLVVESLDESFKGNDHSRTVRRTGSGYSIKVHLYIDREFVRTEELVTAR